MEQIDTLEDPRLDAYARLTDVQMRNKLEPERGILIAESAKVIGRGLDAGMEPLSLLTSGRLAEGVSSLTQRLEQAWPDIPLFVLPEAELEQLAGFKLAHGALAAFRRPALPQPEALLSHARRVAVLEDITNFTNVGAIFRSAAALGLDAVFVTPGCYDPFYRRAVRVSMGGVFQVPWTYIGEGASGRGAHGNVERQGGWTRTGIPLLREAGFKVAAMALMDDALSLADERLLAKPKLAIVVGTEGEGLSPATINAADYVVKIPMQHGVDSLNVATAAAIAFWQVRI